MADVGDKATKNKKKIRKVYQKVRIIASHPRPTCSNDEVKNSHFYLRPSNSSNHFAAGLENLHGS